jgi:hypothetical protein
MKEETRVREEYERKLADPEFLKTRLEEITYSFVTLTPKPAPVPPPDPVPEPVPPSDVPPDRPPIAGVDVPVEVEGQDQGND